MPSRKLIISLSYPLELLLPQSDFQGKNFGKNIWCTHERIVVPTEPLAQKKERE
jgi:hypothetical protein